MSAKHIIELNGKRYDAATGRLVETEVPVHVASKPANSTARKISISPAVAADPTTHTSLTSHTAPVTHSPAATHAVSQMKPAKTRHHSVAKAAVAHSVHKAATLNRKYVKKPSRRIHIEQIQSAAERTVEVSINSPLHDNFAQRQSGDRLKRAEQSHPSKLIQKFHQAVPAVTTVITEVPVVSAPIHAATKAEKFLESQLSNATSHLQQPARPAKKHRAARTLGVSHRTLKFASVLIAVGVLSGFVVFHNANNFALRLASQRAGITAKLPGYMPVGYSQDGPIHYSPGRVSISFKTGENQNKLTLQQEQSAWNNSELLQNAVALGNQPYQVYQDSSATIYIVNSTNALWVNTSKGMRYTIESNTPLDSETVAKIAHSL